jgi:hypothetical protein
MQVILHHSAALPTTSAVRDNIPSMRHALLLSTLLPLLHAQSAIPTFRVTVGQSAYTLAGRDPSRGGTTTIPTLLVPVDLAFDAKPSGG